MKTVTQFKDRKGGEPISMSTAYTAWEGRFLAASPIDCVLVGDSVATVVDGCDTTFSATPEIMARHTAAVSRGLAGSKLIITDFPFLVVRKGLKDAIECAALLFRNGANAVKIEGIEGQEDIIRHLVGSGIPVMVHLGLTPQFVHSLGGYKVQGRPKKEAEALLRQAVEAEKLGAFGVLLECVPADLAGEITKALSIPTIGIGAGPHTDGQVLVFHDFLGLNPGFQPKFVRRFANLEDKVAEGLAAYDAATKKREFPAEAECY